MGDSVEAIVEFDYTAKEEDELTIKKGEIIKNVKIMEGGWWEGTLNGKHGVFPDNFVKVMKGRKDSTSSQKGIKFYRVAFPYKPANEDELELKDNELIEFLGEVEEGWWRGKINNKVGVFPSNFVKEDSEIPTPPVAVEKIKEPAVEKCKVLFAYTAANEDELSLNVGDLISIISKHTEEKGWWKGEINGRKGVFPDNFVELVSVSETDGKKPASIQKARHFPDEKLTNQKRNNIIESAKTPPKEEKSTPPAVPSKPVIGIKIPVIPTITQAQAQPQPTAIPTINTNSVANSDFDSVGRTDLLIQPIRVKAPRRRPPSSVYKETQENGNNTMMNGNGNSTKENNVLHPRSEVILPKKNHDSIPEAHPWVEELKKMSQNRKSLVEKFENADKKKPAEPIGPPPVAEKKAPQPVAKPSNVHLKTSIGIITNELNRISPTKPSNDQPDSLKPSMIKSESMTKSLNIDSTKCQNCPGLEERIKTLEEKVEHLERYIKLVTETMEEHVPSFALKANKCILSIKN